MAKTMSGMKLMVMSPRSNMSLAWSTNSSDRPRNLDTAASETGDKDDKEDVLLPMIPSLGDSPSVSEAQTVEERNATTWKENNRKRKFKLVLFRIEMCGRTNEGENEEPLLSC